MAAAAYRDATAAAAAVGSRIMALNLGPSKGPTGPQRSDSRYDGRGLGKDPLLSRYICNTAVGSDQVGRSMRGGGGVREVVLAGSVSDRPNRGEPTWTACFKSIGHQLSGVSALALRPCVQPNGIV